MEKNIDFNEYLISKKIDHSKFKLEEKEAFDKLESIFLEMHPDSFTAQKLFLINPLRRKYLLMEQEVEKSVKSKMKFKPKFK